MSLLHNYCSVYIKASAFRLVFLWMLPRWRMVREMKPNLLLYFFRGVFWKHTENWVILRHLASIIRFWELLNSSYLSWSFTLKKQQMSELGNPRASAETDLLCTFKRQRKGSFFRLHWVKFTQNAEQLYGFKDERNIVLKWQKKKKKQKGKKNICYTL